MTSGKTWAKAGVSAVGGAISGAVAASGLGAMAQAGISAVVSGVSNLADQVITKGVDNIDAGEVITSAAMGGGFSLIGTGAGSFTAGKLKKAGAALIDKGRDKLLTGVLRRSMGQSHSALIRQGAKFMAEGTKKLNTFKGVSSVLGSVIGGIGTWQYNTLRRNTVL